MIIHVVQPGETIESIAQMYGVPVSEFVRDNGLELSRLVVGQAVVIAYPEQVYTVQEGDTLDRIAQVHNTTELQLLRNNPFLLDGEAIYPGETLIISYDNSKGLVDTNGYANSFINRDILRRALPYLTYLSIFGYRILADGEIIGVEDGELIQTAKEYGVAPVMMLSTLTQQGIGDVDTAYQLLYSKEKQDRLIRNMLRLLRTKGYYGVNFSYIYMSWDNAAAYEALTENLASSLKREGFRLFITITPLLSVMNGQIVYEKLDYSKIGALADNIIVMNYNWGYNYRPPEPVTSITFMREFLGYIITQISREKITVGFPLLGYVWELPYDICISKASALTIESSITLASDVGAPIRFDEVSQTPYYSFITDSSGVPRQYIVWFADVRTADAFTGLVPEYGLTGIGMWNIMFGLSRIYLVINSQYQIRTLLPVTVFETQGS